MKHVRNISIAPASTNPTNSISLGFLIWIWSMVVFKRTF